MITVGAHARKRTIERYAVMPKEANRWANDRLKECTFLDTQEDGRKRYVHPTEPIFIVTTAKGDEIISIIDKPMENVTVKSAFLDAMMPTLEREYAKMKRGFRVQLRNIEKEMADVVVAKGNAMQRRVRVYNPNTQAIIVGEIESYEGKIELLEQSAQDLRSEYEIASLKVRAFLRTATGQPR